MHCFSSALVCGRSMNTFARPCYTYLGREAFGELLHVIIPIQLPDLGANRVDAPEHAGSIGGNGLRILHPDTVFTCDVVGLPVGDRLAHGDQLPASCRAKKTRRGRRER